MKNEITIPVRLDEKTFKRFSRFDMLRLRKQWVRPTVFALILIAFAAVALLTGKEQAAMIAAVLLLVGLGLPLVYFGSFISQVNVQALQNKLKPPRLVYSVTLRDSGIRVENLHKKEAPLELAWEKIPQAFKAKGCVYLYVTPAKAFLLPDGQGNAAADEVWAYLVQHMGEKKCKKL